MKKIWFNRWFSNAYYFMNLIRNNTDNMDVYIYGSHPNKNIIYSTACDHFEVEPLLSGDEYVEYCIDFCKKNEIDIFIPYTELLSISKHIKRFEQIGTKVLVSSNYELLKIIDNKAMFYEQSKSTNIFTIPEYYVVNSASQFREAYERLRENHNKVCMKPVSSIGGFGFRVIDDSASTLNNLLGDINHKVSYEEVLKILSKQETFKNIMVMEYLDGPEYSIDCLAYNKELLAAVPRKKVDSRVRVLEDIPELIALAEKTESLYNLPYIFNIQVKYKNSIPKLLEINPRMSGGLNATCFCGINYPYYAVKLLLGEKVTVPKPNLNIATTKLEHRFILDNNI